MSGGGSGGGSTTSTNTNVNYSPEEAAKRAQVMDEAQKVYNQTSGQMSSAEYPGAKPVGFSPETTVAQNLAVQNAASAQNSVGQINQGVNYGLTTAMDVDNNPYLQKAMKAATQQIDQSYTDAGGVMSGIRTDATNAGQYGGSRQGIAEGLASGRHDQAVANATSTMATDAYNKGQDTFAKTLTFAPQAIEASNIPVNMLSSVGAQKENLGTEQANYEANKAMWGLNSPWAGLQNYASIVYGGATPSTTTTASTNNAARTGIGQAAGGAMTAASLYQMMQA